MKTAQLVKVARQLCQPGKGILAADESGGTIEKRFKTINLPSTETNRKAWRELLLATPGINQFISGVILYDETIRQGLGKILLDQGILVGIKVDQGLNAAMVTEGLVGLKERLMEYIKLGAVFTKWRAVITIGGQDNLEENALRLAEYAKVVQGVGLVPIVEPEILMAGSHDIRAHAQATKKTLAAVFRELNRYRIYLPGMLLKTNMVSSGLEAKKQSGPREIAKATIAVFKAAVPKSVPGIMFLSGGMSPEASTVNLDAINKTGKQPWQLSFSYGRALQGEALEIWNGQSRNKAAAQKAYFDRAEKVALARQGSL